MCSHLVVSQYDDPRLAVPVVYVKDDSSHVTFVVYAGYFWGHGVGDIYSCLLSENFLWSNVGGCRFPVEVGLLVPVSGVDTDAPIPTTASEV